MQQPLEPSVNSDDSESGGVGVPHSPGQVLGSGSTSSTVDDLHGGESPRADMPEDTLRSDPIDPPKPKRHAPRNVLNVTKMGEINLLEASEEVNSLLALSLIHI